ncbi:discoidin domain-containing protein [Sandaracinus amylolyticus]|uniref:discoidin domain-containing protein n=1 Tax=Sandaracinus amylolyticus TaxID=927083 RepID=UPI001F2546E8|nr:discoidin domain-containing protein [Sandaracinus amylolyticus]UJR81416.1 Hypothetical protein I5071_34740 [Sandaracinus amylolyticus]
MSEPETEAEPTSAPAEPVPAPDAESATVSEPEPPPAPATPAAPAGPVHAPTSLGERIVEHFTLRRALGVEAKLGDAARERLARTLALGTQRADAAESLWQNGHSAEGLRLGVEALDVTLDALPIYAGAMSVPGADFEADPKAARAATLRARGVRPDAIAAIEAAREAAHASPLPVEEREVTPAHTSLWRQIAGAQHTVGRALADAARSRRQLRTTSIGRIANTVLIVGVVLVGWYFATREPEGVFADASGVWADSDTFSPDKAIDGRADTFWLAPDGVEATLDVRISPPRRVDRVRLINGTNPPHLDRGTRDYRVEVFSDGEVVRTEEGTLAQDATPVELEVGTDAVQRIRFTARSHYRNSAGLAELQLE